MNDKIKNIHKTKEMIEILSNELQKKIILEAYNDVVNDKEFINPLKESVINHIKNQFNMIN